MKPEVARAAVEAMIDAADPAFAAAIAGVVRDGDHEDETPDEDDAPPDQAAADRVTKWILARTGQLLGRKPRD